ncbi:MAG TPA: alpha/beta fold hydrolase [Actinomycetes bacterium]|nr:alpha/beta fold hydrolase [Actinomycetes bacterium]
MPLLPGAEPAQFDGGPVGVVVVHGFTGSPGGVRAWGEYLAEHGLTVAVPRLPGHGTTWQELAHTSWQDWYGEVERTFVELTDRCETVFAMGLSMGATLCLRLAQVHDTGVRGLVLVNPFLSHPSPLLPLLPALRFVLPSVPGVVNDIAKPGQDEVGYSRVPLQALHSVTRLWRHVIPELPSMTRPTLLFRSQTDNVLGARGAAMLLRRIGATDVEERVLPDSHHVATLDYDAPTIFEGSLEFVQRLVPDAEPAGGGS